MSASLAGRRRRPGASIARSLGDRRHWLALLNMARLYPSFPVGLRRYVLGGGSYPYECAVRTPIGTVRPTLYQFDDMLTLNCIFCRRDYAAPRGARVVVDVGANIGLSALYFLTRNAACRCYAYEPDPRNVPKLRRNLAAHEDRYVLEQVAVADVEGPVEFGIEPTGVYGGIDRRGHERIRVDCRHVNSVLADVLAREPRIDVLKVDTEGREERTIRSIDPDLLGRIDTIYYEQSSPAPIDLLQFDEVAWGKVRHLRRRAGHAVRA